MVRCNCVTTGSFLSGYALMSPFLSAILKLKCYLLVQNKKNPQDLQVNDRWIDFQILDLEVQMTFN